MILLPYAVYSEVNHEELVNEIEEVLIGYDHLLESRIGELELEECNETNWLFINTNFTNPNNGLDNLFGIATGTELQSCRSFIRLASINVPDTDHDDDERKLLYVYNYSNLEFICDFDNSNDKDLKDGSEAIALRVKQILEEIEEGSSYE